ncbi:MAG TPA: T9SS type A sorting domain-containing protein [Ignavibacteria bacterium]|nr:T9SS type A sorting domain-containing protein [Ignavibacteria bacterium]
MLYCSPLAQTITAPSNLEAEPEEFSYIKVKWDDNSNNEEGFYIERSYTPDTVSGWEVIGSVNQNSRQFFDYWVANNVTYYYRVYAYAGTERSEYSNIAFTTAIIDTNLIPMAPSDLIITDTTSTSITINWQDNSNNESGFIIARRKQDEVLFTYIDTVEADILTYQEVGLTPDNLYFYKVCAYNNFGLSDFTNTVHSFTQSSTSIINHTNQISDKFYLDNNFPNPFNPSTNISFGLSASAFVKLNIYNSQGKEVELLVNQRLPQGSYKVIWNAGNFSGGVYFYRLETDNYSETKKMILIK